MKARLALFNLDSPETVGAKLFFRLLEASVILWTIRFVWQWGTYIEQIPEVVLPLGIANYVDVSFMFDSSIALVNASVISILLLIGFVGRYRYAYFSAFLLFHVQYVSRYSLGAISHGSNLIGMCLLGLALGHMFYSKIDLQRKFSLGFIYFFIGLAYTSAAICKLAATGPSWVSGSHLWMWIAERGVDTYSSSGVFDYNFLQELILEFGLLGTAILTFGLVTEFLAFLVWFKKPRRYIFALLFIMHIGILISMKISFESNLFLILMLAGPWPAALDWTYAKLQEWNQSLASRIISRLT